MVTQPVSTDDQIAKDQKVLETWEVQVPGTIYVLKLDRRKDEYVKTRLNGTRGPKRVTLTRDDRKYNQEQVRPEYVKHDPFQNGALAQVVDGELVGITDVELSEMLQVREMADFTDLVSSIDNELTARRLLAVARTEGTLQQYEVVRDHIEDNWKVGGTQPTVEEMFAEASSGEQPE